MTTASHTELLAAIDTYNTESAKFAGGANKAAGNRAKRALRDITKLARIRRDEAHAITNPESAAKKATVKAAKAAAKAAANPA
jgi:hypothetical protein